MHYKQFIVPQKYRNLKQNHTSNILCHRKAAASIIRATVFSVVSYTHASPSGLVSEMTYNVSSGTLNTTIPYLLDVSATDRATGVDLVGIVCRWAHQNHALLNFTYLRWTHYAAISCPATWSINFMSCIFMSCYLVHHFHVLQFHVRHFQRPPIRLNDQLIPIPYKPIPIRYIGAYFQCNSGKSDCIALEGFTSV